MSPRSPHSYSVFIPFRGVRIPEANPALSIGAALGVTFPFNVVLGVPLYFQMTHWYYAAF